MVAKIAQVSKNVILNPASLFNMVFAASAFVPRPIGVSSWPKGKIISASQLLERFLFDAKKQYDYVEKLSGGELKRLYLCTVLIQNPNFLILDEPTNDLDEKSENTICEILNSIKKSMIIVSHHKSFIDKLTLTIYRLNKSLIKE